jgi:hypothetical protein
LFYHTSRPVTFALIVDNFGVKYVNKEHADHLIAASIKDLYTITTDWHGTLYCGITIKWDYTSRTVDSSTPGYIEKALKTLCVTTPQRPQHLPYAWLAPTYGASIQYTTPNNISTPFDQEAKTRIQDIIETLLYYGRAIDLTILVALGTLANAQANGTEATTQAVTQLLNYCMSHPSAMHLHIHSDASYLSVSKARSHAGGIFFLSDKPGNQPPDPTSTPPPINGAVHIQALLHHETHPILPHRSQKRSSLIQCNIALTEMGHPQAATPLQTDNQCASGIVNDTVKQCRSKAMDMHFYWVKDRIAQGEYNVHWRKGTNNLADYFTKHHSPAHHHLMRSCYLLELYNPNCDTTVNQTVYSKGVLISPSTLPQDSAVPLQVTLGHGTSRTHKRSE